MFDWPTVAKENYERNDPANFAHIPKQPFRLSWAGRATLIFAIFTVCTAFVIAGGATRHYSLNDLGIICTIWGIPIAIFWLVLKLIFGNRGAY